MGGGAGPNYGRLRCVKSIFFASRARTFFLAHRAVRCARRPSQPNFFSGFLAPGRRYSDSVGGPFWRANRFNKTRTFNNGPKRATRKTHAQSQNTVGSGFERAQHRGQMFDNVCLFQKLCQGRGIHKNCYKKHHFFEWKNRLKILPPRRYGRFFEGAPNPQNDDQNDARPPHFGSQNPFYIRGIHFAMFLFKNRFP